MVASFQHLLYKTAEAEKKIIWLHKLVLLAFINYDGMKMEVQSRAVNKKICLGWQLSRKYLLLCFKELKLPVYKM